MSAEYSAEEEAFLADKRARVEERLREVGVEAKPVQHERVFTVETAAKATGHLAGKHSKNLVLKTKKGQLWLVVLDAERAVDLSSLAQQLGATGGVRFAAREVLRETLGVLRGRLVPFAFSLSARSKCGWPWAPSC